MNIAIGINIFGTCPRQQKCIEVLKKISLKYSNVKLYNIFYPNEKNLDEAFIPLPLLNEKAKDVIHNSNSQKPIAKEFFDILSKQNCEYFIFLNSDILLSPKFLNLVLEGEYETYCVSRHDTHPIQSLENIVPYRIEIAGFDVWAIKKDWWSSNNIHFEKYIYAEHLWDVAFTLKMYNLSKCIILNKEFYAAHEKHDIKWSETSPEAVYNSKLWEKNPLSIKWKQFIFENLIKREPYGQFLIPLENEKELEEKYLRL
jgi:hypothetical protein